MTDLTTWLLAQIAAEEERARAERERRDEWYREYGGRAAIAVTEWDIANDPAATLRRCAALREVINVARYAPDGPDGWGYRRTLRTLASIYADADGYDPSWRLG